MSTQAIIGAINNHTSDSEPENMLNEALSITQFALAEAMMELDKATRNRVVEQVNDELKMRAIARTVAA